MTLSRITPIFVTLTLILLLAPSGAAVAEVPAPNGSVGQPPPVEAAPPSPDAGPQKAADGHWFMPAGSRSDAAFAAAPQDSGGPDDFGYTWNDWEPFVWIDASGGTDTGIDSGTESAGPIDIGFPFKFYENTRSEVYISRHGFLVFNGDNLGNSQSEIPSPERPNDVIAPHWVPIYEVAGYVRYLRGEPRQPLARGGVEPRGIRAVGVDGIYLRGDPARERRYRLPVSQL